MLLLSLAGVGRFELPNDGVKVRCLTAWLYPIKFYSFPPILRYSIHLSEISAGSYSHIDIVVSQPLTTACDLGLQAVVS